MSRCMPFDASTSKACRARSESMRFLRRRQEQLLGSWWPPSLSAGDTTLAEAKVKAGARRASARGLTVSGRESPSRSAFPTFRGALDHDNLKARMT